MIRQNLTTWLVTIAIVMLISGLTHLQTAKADLPVVPAQQPQPSQGASAAPAPQCMECHHSELLSRVVQLTTDPKPDLRPAWSPDGTRLAFYSGRSGNDDIWAIDVDGNGEAQLTSDPGRDRRPSWSPDGSKIVFDSNRAGTHDIWIMNADGSDQRPLTTGSGQEMFASFSPDGSQIIYYGYKEGRNDIWTMEIDGSNPRSLTSGLADEKESQCTFACHTPAFSPDGNTIAFHADNDGARNIWVMDADGNNPRQLTVTDTNSDTSNYLPSWSPDGRIIFQAERPVAMSIRTDIRMINPDGSDEITLFAEVAHGGPFVWSPDGTQVAVHSQQGGAGNFDIFVATFGEAAEEGQSNEEETPADEEAPVEEEAPAEEGSPPEEEAPAEEEAPVEEEAPAEAEASVAEAAPAEEEASVEGETAAEAEVSSSNNELTSSAVVGEDRGASPPGSTGTWVIVGGSLLLILAVIGYSLRRFRRS
jgi:Tol biopolymer transport system component